MKLKTIIALCGFCVALNAEAVILTVPGSHSTIQAAINASSNGDTIVVSPGTYFENINFRGKNVFLTSLYYMAGDTAYISTTIINGSTPIHPDTASCVIFNSGEDSSAVLQGFTITGGTGTKWVDIHGAGKYREGGGILIELSSPTITHNIIRNNFATSMAGVSGAGGGGIRVGDGNPTICSNQIIFNDARYGPGIVLNYSGARITNNIIASNTGGQTFNGGSGIWIIDNFGAVPKIIENNTIVNNYSSLSSGTGGILSWGASYVFIRNNIIYGNLPAAAQVKTISSVPQVTYSNIQGGFTGAGNINQNPMFESAGYYLASSSPCIDAGDTALVYRDIEDNANPGFALFPAAGTLRNDMGAYGGSCAALLPILQSATGVNEETETIAWSIFPSPASDFVVVDYRPRSKSAFLEIVDLTGSCVRKEQFVSSKPLNISKLGTGLYLVKITDGNIQLTKRLVKN